MTTNDEPRLEMESIKVSVRSHRGNTGSGPGDSKYFSLSSPVSLEITGPRDVMESLGKIRCDYYQSHISSPWSDDNKVRAHVNRHDFEKIVTHLKDSGCVFPRAAMAQAEKIFDTAEWIGKGCPQETRQIG